MRFNWSSAMAARRGLMGGPSNHITARPETRQQWLEQLQRELQTKTYRPSPVRRGHIPKPNGGQKTLGNPPGREPGGENGAPVGGGPHLQGGLYPETGGVLPPAKAPRGLCRPTPNA